MAKFRKRISIAPGVKINLSKSGVSGTFGVRGASVNVGKNGAFVNTGIPGTGIYDRHKLGGARGANETESGEVPTSGKEVVPIGKIGRRVFFIIFLVCACFCVISLFRGHFFWAFFQGFLALVMLITPYVSNAKAAEVETVPEESVEAGNSPAEDKAAPV